MSEIVWEEPPSWSGGKGQFDWAAVAALLRRRPKEWAIVRVMADSMRSTQTAHYIKSGKLAAFRPAGDFEARARCVDGEYRVYARYVGGTP